MTVQSQIDGAMSQSADAAQSVLQWHPNKSESMKALVSNGCLCDRAHLGNSLLAFSVCLFLYDVA